MPAKESNVLTNTERSYAILDVHLRGGGHGLTCVWPVLLVLSVALEGDSLACTPVYRCTSYVPFYYGSADTT